jgi:hypothetical protein
MSETKFALQSALNVFLSESSADNEVQPYIIVIIITSLLCAQHTAGSNIDILMISIQINVSQSVERDRLGERKKRDNETEFEF